MYEVSNCKSYNVCYSMKPALRPGIANLNFSEGGILVFRLRGGIFWKIPPPP